jgi:hypothetical protein
MAIEAIGAMPRTGGLHMPRLEELQKLGPQRASGHAASPAGADEDPRDDPQRRSKAPAAMRRAAVAAARRACPAAVLRAAVAAVPRPRRSTARRIRPATARCRRCASAAATPASARGAAAEAARAAAGADAPGSAGGAASRRRHRPPPPPPPARPTRVNGIEGQGRRRRPDPTAGRPGLRQGDSTRPSRETGVPKDVARRHDLAGVEGPVPTRRAAA